VAACRRAFLPSSGLCLDAPPEGLKHFHRGKIPAGAGIHRSEPERLRGYSTLLPSRNARKSLEINNCGTAYSTQTPDLSATNQAG
jgi:hypothetical protein